jgi:hypothetical protein
MTLNWDLIGNITIGIVLAKLIVYAFEQILLSLYGQRDKDDKPGQ